MSDSLRQIQQNRWLAWDIVGLENARQTLDARYTEPDATKGASLPSFNSFTFFTQHRFALAILQRHSDFTFPAVIAVMVMSLFAHWSAQHCQASCGDYVTIGNPRPGSANGARGAGRPMADHSDSDPQELPNTGAADSTAPHNNSSAPICNGPQCRSSVPPASPLAPIGNEFNPTHEVGIWIVSRQRFSAPREPVCGMFLMGESQFIPSRLDRPPQTVAI